MLVLDILNFCILGFVGYLIGRWGDNYLNFWIGDPSWTPDHWIYGSLIMIVGLFVFKGYLELSVFSFGLGLFISDLRDFLKLKFYGSDNKDRTKTKFWHID